MINTKGLLATIGIFVLAAVAWGILMNYLIANFMASLAASFLGGMVIGGLTMYLFRGLWLKHD